MNRWSGFVHHKHQSLAFLVFLFITIAFSFSSDDADNQKLDGCWLGYWNLDFFGGKCWIGLEIDIRSGNKIDIVFHRISGVEEFQKCRQISFMNGKLRFELATGSAFELSVDFESRTMSGSLKTKDWIFPTYLEYDPEITAVNEDPRFFKKLEYQYRMPVQTDDGLSPASIHDVRVSPDNIEALMTLILNGTYKNIRSFLVIKDGKLVIEEYFWQKTVGGFPYYLGHDEPQNMFSATRTITASLVGIALDQGLIPGVGEKLVHYFPEYEDLLNTENKGKIALDHLLTMESGFRWEQADIDGYGPLFDQIRSPAGFPILRYLFERPVSSSPGRVYVYNNELSTVIGEIVSRRADMPLVDFAAENLFDPLGISKFSWHVYPDGLASGGNGLRLRPRDMAKFGMLFVNGGLWDSRQILSREWLEKSFQRRTAVGNTPYGYHWWLNTFYVNGQRIFSPNARGHYGQFLFVFPTLNMVCVVTSAADETHPWDQPVEMIAKYLLPAVLPSLKQTPEKKTVKVEKKNLDDLAGVYQHEEGRYGMLARRGTNLHYKPPGRRFFRLSAAPDQRFSSEKKDIVLFLSNDQDGRYFSYAAVIEGIEEKAIKIESIKNGDINKNIVVLPRTALFVCALALALVVIISLFRTDFPRLRRRKFKESDKTTQKKLSRLTQVWAAFCTLAGIFIILLIWKDGVVLEEILNLGTYQPGWDETSIIWTYSILIAGLVLLTFRAWTKGAGTILGRSLLTAVSFVSTCLIAILFHIGLLIFFP